MNKLFSILFLVLLFKVSAAATEIANRTLVWSDGTRYVGGVIEGKRSGKGTIFWQDGTRFVGEFKNDKRNGSGTMIMPDGTIYSGIFLDDQLVKASQSEHMDVPGLSNKKPSSGITTNLDELVESERIEKSSEIVQPGPAFNSKVLEAEAGNSIILIPERQMPIVLDDPYAPVTVVTNRIRSEVQEMVNLWGSAWSEQNVPQYLSNYSDDFVITDSISRRGWEVLRRNRLTRPKYIDIKISHERIELVAEDTIDVFFSQTYRSNLYRDITKKVLRIKREEQGWRIIEEKSR